MPTVRPCVRFPAARGIRRSLCEDVALSGVTVVTRALPSVHPSLAAVKEHHQIALARPCAYAHIVIRNGLWRNDL